MNAPHPIQSSTPGAAAPQRALSVLEREAQLAAVLTPIRRDLLQRLHEPHSAAGLATQLGVPRQKLNYHLRELERQGLVEVVEQRQRRGFVERCYRVTAQAFVVNPAFLGALGADPAQLRDRFSSAYLLALASRTLEDVATLRARADAVAQPLTTLSLETEVAFGSPAKLKAFAEALGAAVARLVAEYHEPEHADSRTYRFALGAYPKITKDAAQAEAEQRAHHGKRAKAVKNDPQSKHADGDKQQS